MPDPDPLYSLPGRQDVPSEVAGRNQAGGVCPHCDSVVKVGAMIRICPDCRTVHHGRCWQKYGRCGALNCSTSKRRPEPVATPVTARPADNDQLFDRFYKAGRIGDKESVLVITSDELARATPLPPRPPGALVRPINLPWHKGPVVNRVAIISLITAIAGIPFFGLVTGLMAIGMAVYAIVQIDKGQDKGKGLAVAGLILGMVDVVGWLIFLGWATSGMNLRDLLKDRVGQPPPAARGSLDPVGGAFLVSMPIAAEVLQSS